MQEFVKFRNYLSSSGPILIILVLIGLGLFFSGQLDSSWRLLGDETQAELTHQIESVEGSLPEEAADQTTEDIQEQLEENKILEERSLQDEMRQKYQQRYQKLLDEGVLTQEQYEEKMRSFQSGIDQGHPHYGGKRD